ncbi:hypothetical protein AR687_20095 [Flavobacteriaceae bacterium CRH]|nr:hypothetical protein AR687_20095 [Flavobacteriaceae bacterium CRH]
MNFFVSGFKFQVFFVSGFRLKCEYGLRRFLPQNTQRFFNLVFSFIKNKFAKLCVKTLRTLRKPLRLCGKKTQCRKPET